MSAHKNFDLKTFTFNGHTLRIVLIDGRPWFIAVDVCAALGVSRKNVTYYVKTTLNPGEILFIQRDADMPETLRHMRGFATGFNLVSESGLFKIALRAQRSNPAAREFQDWVTREVLPRIRRDGRQSAGPLETGQNGWSEWAVARPGLCR